jgi:hypothetical protein
MSRARGRREEGASLVELAVVIAIIALVVSVMSGAIKIQRASFIQGVVSDVSGFQTAFENFREQYAGFPGDLEDATDHWGDETENGNGDNEIVYASSGNCEALRAWQQLALAGLVQGGYKGASSGSGNQADLGVNVPMAPKKKIGYFIDYGRIGSSKERNEIVLGAFLAGGKNEAAALEPKDAKAIDLKADDGLPTSGKIRAGKGADMASDTCVSSEGYDLGTADPACIMAFPALP